MTRRGGDYGSKETLSGAALAMRRKGLRAARAYIKLLLLRMFKAQKRAKTVAERN